MNPDLLATAPLWYVVFLLSTTCHEAAHALAAKIGGDDTAALGGQVTLNPVPHIQREPLGMVVVPLISLLLGGVMFGWASAPYDPFWRQRYPHRAAWMALAGPAANFALVLVAAAAIHVGIGMGSFEMPASASFSDLVDPLGGEWSAGVGTALSILFSLNLLLGAFNLLPVPPLDGATVIGLFMSEEQALRVWAFLHQPQFGMVGLLLAWYVFGEIFSPLFWTAMGVLYPGTSWG